jgi:hypothetical protein
MAKDVFHQQVKKALIKDGWIITHDPFTIRISEAIKLQIDLAAENAIAAERNIEKIMDKIERYRQFIKQVLSEHQQIASNTDTVNSQLILDNENDHYQLAYVGWQGDKRVFGPVMHFDIQNGKIWIQYNGTEESVAERLVKLGVPSSDIVIGFHSPFKRQFTSYAVE